MAEKKKIILQLKKLFLETEKNEIGCVNVKFVCGGGDGSQHP